MSNSLPPRISRKDWFMKFACVTSERSTCARIQTGAVLVKDDRIVSVGLNGSLPGDEHCCDYWYDKYSNDKNLDITWEEYLQTHEFKEQHHEWAISREFHAEANCILWSSKNGSATKDTTMYTVFSPCLNCAKIILGAGIKEVYYKVLYERDQKGLELLQKHNIPCLCIKI